MQMLNRIILLSLLSIAFLCSCANTQANPHKKGCSKLSCEFIGFKFIRQDKVVWVYAPKDQTILESREITKSKYRQYKYEVTDFSTLNFPPARFENKNGELFVNGLSLGKRLTALVEADGSVSIGQSIANTYK